MDKGKTSNFEFRLKDEVSYSMHNGVIYGQIIRITTPGDNGAVEIEYEDGRREVKKVRDRSLRLLRRYSGASEADEAATPRTKARDTEIDEVRRSDIRRR